MGQRKKAYAHNMNTKKEVHVIFAHVPTPGSYLPPKAKLYSTSRKNVPMVYPMNIHNQCIVDVILYSPDGRNSSVLKALIDTGTYHSFVSFHKVDESIMKTGEKGSYQPFGGDSKEFDFYKCRMSIPSMFTEAEFTFGKTIPPFENIDIVMGSHFLSNFIFKYNYPKKGEFSLEPLHAE